MEHRSLFTCSFRVIVLQMHLSPSFLPAWLFRRTTAILRSMKIVVLGTSTGVGKRHFREKRVQPEPQKFCKTFPVSLDVSKLQAGR